MKKFILVVVLFGAACVAAFAEFPQTGESKLDALIAKIETLERDVLALKTHMQDLSQQETNDRGLVSVIKTQMQDLSQQETNDRSLVSVIKMQMQDMSQRVINNEGQIRAVIVQMGLVRPSVQQQERQAEYNRQEEIQQAINDPGRY
jgi:hypothetical protein